MWVFCQKQASAFPSEVASAGILRPLLANDDSAPTSDGPKSETMASIFGYFAIAAVRTVWVRAGSQLVGSNGCWPLNFHLPAESYTPFKPSPSPPPRLFL